MLQTKRKTITIGSIRRAAGTIGDGGVRRPGNLIINNLWFSSRELRNVLIGAGLDPNIPVLALKGAKISYDEVAITPEILAENGGEVKMTINGREVTFKKPGVNQVNMDIDFTSINVTENLLNLAKLSQMYAGQQRVQRTVAPTPRQENLEDTGLEEEDEAEEAENQGVQHESLHEGAQNAAANVQEGAPPITAGG